MLSACGPNYGNEIHGGNLTVYFKNGDDKQLAEQIALYWKDHRFLTGTAQSIQIERKKQKVYLRLVANEPKGASNLSFVELKKMLELQDDLRELTGRKHLEIVICDKRFETLKNINE
ncbi:MAG: hypothetical protein A3D92_10620 [Bacteroidetes bacterium RIFCSPHIGHO2_02_FULL_44_7]|nr:MAG: hypothetical protein A3D92_10620 [Bacteroidetes bacterium RIFCSPHIGHO2_02_FULL_44_7]